MFPWYMFLIFHSVVSMFAGMLFGAFARNSRQLLIVMGLGSLISFSVPFFLVSPAAVWTYFFLIFIGWAVGAWVATSTREALRGLLAPRDRFAKPS